MSKSLKLMIGTAALVAMTACAGKEKPEQPMDPVAQKQAAAAQAQAQANLAEAAAQRAQNDVARAQLGQDRDAYVANTQQRIERLTKRSDDLHARADKATGPQKTKLQNISEDLDGSLTQIRRDFTSIQQVAPQNYLDQKRVIEKDIGRAEESYASSLNVYGTDAAPAAPTQAE